MNQKCWYAFTVAVLIAKAWFMAMITGAYAADWANSPYAGWADKQVVMESARPRLHGQVKCCNKAEIVKTKFAVSKNARDEDEWFYLTPEGSWKQIPQDIIHPIEEETPTGQPVLFIWDGKEVCFWVGGING